jgi:hypothetical protein
MRVIEHDLVSGFRPYFTILPCPFTAFFHLPFLVSQVLGFLIPVFHDVKEQPALLFALARNSQNNHRKWLRPPAHHPNMPSIEIKR